MRTVSKKSAPSFQVNESKHRPLGRHRSTLGSWQLRRRRKVRVRPMCLLIPKPEQKRRPAQLQEFTEKGGKIYALQGARKPQRHSRIVGRSPVRSVPIWLGSFRREWDIRTRRELADDRRTARVRPTSSRPAAARGDRRAFGGLRGSALFRFRKSLGYSVPL